jgi:glyoxylase-like metal-dependent hydrolase (beta-lactamase superfamily II)
VAAALSLAAAAQHYGLAPNPAPGPAPPFPPSSHATTKVEGTDNVYLFRNGNVQSLFIVTPEGVIATDPNAYGKPGAGELYLAEIRRITDRPVRYVVYSHHHLDHTVGGKPFKDAGATFVAHRRARERLAILADPETVLPDEVVGDEGRAITLGGVTIELRYLGLGHSDSLLVMRLPRERLVYVVDAIPVGTLPAHAMIDNYPLELESFIEAVIAMDWDRLVPGHPGVPGGRLGTKKDARDLLAALRTGSAEMRALARAGKCWAAAEKEFRLAGLEHWPNHAQARPFWATRYCALWGRGF